MSPLITVYGSFSKGPDFGARWSESYGYVCQSALGNDERFTRKVDALQLPGGIPDVRDEFDFAECIAVDCAGADVED